MQGEETALPKINPYLAVTGRRQDGYHDIETVFLPLTRPADTIRIAPAPTGEMDIVCADPRVPTGEANLCRQAAMQFAEARNLTPAWRIEIEKHIPVAAGLGGGSSDAAAVLRGLNRLSGSPFSASQLRELAAPLGADVPFFVDSVPALGTGIGQDLTPVPCALRAGILLVNPRFPVSARWAYANLGRCPAAAAPPVANLIEALAAGSLDRFASYTCNMLEGALLDKFPLVHMLRDSLLSLGCRCAHVSGSGPTLFGCCRAEAAEDIAAALRSHYGGAVDIVVAEVAAP